MKGLYFLDCDRGGFPVYVDSCGTVIIGYDDRCSGSWYYYKVEKICLDKNGDIDTVEKGDEWDPELFD